jgi:hypothetical protein
LSDSATNSLTGLLGSYDFYLIRDRHFKTASDIVERFLDRYQLRWKKSSREINSISCKVPLMENITRKDAGRIVSVRDVRTLTTCVRYTAWAADSVQIERRYGSNRISSRLSTILPESSPNFTR